MFNSYFHVFCPKKSYLHALYVLVTFLIHAHFSPCNSFVELCYMYISSTTFRISIAELRIKYLIFYFILTGFDHENVGTSEHSQSIRSDR